MGKEKTYNKVYILGGMRFSTKNAACHRALGLAKLFSEYVRETVLFGFSDEGHEEGAIDGFKYYTLKYPQSKKEWIDYCFSINYYSRILSQLASSDILVVNSTIPSFITRKLISICAKKNVCLVLDVDEWYSYRFESFLRSIIKNLSTWYQMHVVCKKRLNFIVSSSFLEKHCKNSNSTFVYPAIVTDKIALEKKQETNSFSSNIVNLFFGGLFGKKEKKESLDALIEAVGSINSSQTNITFKLNIVGANGEDTDYISYFGKLPYTDCIKHLVESTFTVIPRNKTRTNEAGFPTKLSESFLYGIPCISTNTSDIKKYIIDGVNGFVIENNSKEEYLTVFNRIIEGLLEKGDIYIKCLRDNVLKNNKLVVDSFKESFDVFVRNVK